MPKKRKQKWIIKNYIRRLKKRNLTGIKLKFEYIF